MLGSINVDFAYVAVTDKRLCPEVDTTRSCGGIAIMYRNTLPVTPLCACENDRLCAVQIQLNPTLTNTSTNLTIIGSYILYSNSSIEEYHHYLSALEQAIVSATSQGSYVIVGGDLNEHLGTLAGSNGRGPSNDRGLPVKKLIDKNILVCRITTTLNLSIFVMSVRSASKFSNKFLMLS